MLLLTPAKLGPVNDTDAPLPPPEPATLDAHAEAMRRHPGMEHEEPHMAHVAPGRQQDLVWRFNRAGRFDFACLIAGHYEAGMRGTFTVTP